MKNKQAVIDFLIQNDELVRDLMRKTNEQISNVDTEFRDEAREQQLDEVGRKLADGIGSSLGLTFEDTSGIVDREVLRKLLEVW